MKRYLTVFILFISISVTAESWTNSAGHAVSATLVFREGNELTFQRADQSVFKMNLKALSSDCQKRVNQRMPLPPSKTKQAQQQRQARLTQLLNEQRADRAKKQSMEENK
ncbi:hypothetical protein P4E94_09455 [Pontiellaceae bacterium B12219]|nr:hypothetical protein [Pontiellaceae bacterium B12219]